MASGAHCSASVTTWERIFTARQVSTISAVLRDRAWGSVPDAFMLYVNPGSTVEAGLRRRRQAEIALWNS